MTTPVRIQQRIRQLEGQGLNHTRIARELGVSRTTVIKYVSRDYSPSPREGAVGSRSLVTGEYARAADEWLTSDLRMPRKQRHTARRVHERLVAELGFPGEYSSVQRWVKRWREAHRRDSDGYAELEWAPGTAQEGLRCGEGRDRGRGTDCALFGGLVPVLEHAVRGRAARGDHGVRVPWSAAGLRTHGHGAQGAGVRQRHRRRTPQRGRHGHADPPVLPVQRALRVPGPGSATRTRATRRAASRTRSGSCAAT